MPYTSQENNLLHASVHQRERDLLRQQENNLLHASAIDFIESNQLHASVTYFISERDLLHQREMFTSSSAREIGVASTGHMTIGSQRTREYGRD